MHLPPTSIPSEALRDVHGGLAMDPSARWIMMRESGGDPTAGHLHASRRHSSAFGAFQMIRANRIKYMGRDFESTDLATQYAGAGRYVRAKHGSWARAKHFWLTHVDQHGHHWY